jgi:hypothetical protein
MTANKSVPGPIRAASLTDARKHAAGSVDCVRGAR